MAMANQWNNFYLDSYMFKNEIKVKIMKMSKITKIN